MEIFHANGKLLISGEYAILHGAMGLALPLKFGQKLMVHQKPKLLEKAQLHWLAHDHNGKLWADILFELNDFKIVNTSNQKTADILKILFHLLPQSAFNSKNDYEFETYLAFDHNWGWGSSSTLVSLIAQFAKTDPYPLYQATFKGSGYDLACATAQQAILFELKNEIPTVKPIDFNPTFKDDIYFIYLGRKQNSLKDIAKRPKPAESLINSITQLGKQLIANQNNKDIFCDTLCEHERLMSSYLEQKTAKEKHFGHTLLTIKSLGAWGGDFVMAIGDKTEIEAIKKQGYSPIFSYDEIVLG